MKKAFFTFLFPALLGCSSTVIAAKNSIPNLNYGAMVVYDDARAPTSNEPDVITNLVPNWIWWNKASNDFYLATSNINTSLSYVKLMTDANAFINSQRDYTPMTLAFNTGHTPNTTHDTCILATYHVNASLLQSSTISIQTDCGSGFNEKTRASTTSGVLVNQDINFSFLVAANCAYKAVASGSGTNTVVSTQEIYL